MIEKKIKKMNGASHFGIKNNDEVGKVGKDQAVDFFSSLPDNVLTKIFSSLTMKEAFYTCISCRKLKHLTTSIPNVEFTESADGCPTKRREFVQSVSRFLDNHDSVVQKFQLSFSPGEYTSEVLRWLSLVVKNGIEKLDLMSDYGNYLEIPTSLLTAETLKVLKLRQCIVDIPSITGFKTLKSLVLGDMYISDEVMALLCCHCESLQKLTLERCSGFEEIEIVNPKSKLETLILDGHCPSLSRLNISNLKTLVICKRNMNFSFIGCPHIDELVLYREAELGITQQESENIKASIINRLQNVRSLHLAGRAFECLAAYRSIENHQLTNLEVLGINFNACLQNQKQLTDLISSAKRLKTLVIWTTQNCYSGHYSIFTDCNFKKVSAYVSDNSYEAEPTFCLRKNAGVNSTGLQKIYIEDFAGTINEVSHIKFMLAHFPHLRVIKVTPIRGMNEDKTRGYAKIFSRFPRVSTGVYMLVGSEKVWEAEEA